MTVVKQKKLELLLHRLQNGMRLTIGPLGELNYEMASKVKSFI